MVDTVILYTGYRHVVGKDAKVTENPVNDEEPAQDHVYNEPQKAVVGAPRENSCEDCSN